MNTDLELYRIFCKVVEYKNISKTARSMYISQSAITQSIQKLEGNLGGKVFYRSKNGVELTEEGKSLYEYVKDSVEIINNAENVFLQYSNLEKGKTRIGGKSSLLESLIFEPILKFMKNYPNINVSINNEITENLMQELANGKLDIVALYLQDDKKYSNIEFIPLKKTSFCFFASKKYIKQKSVKDFKELENHTLILPNAYSSEKKVLDDLCSKKNIVLNANYEVSSDEIMKKMVLNEIGIGFANMESLEDIKDKIVILNEVESIEEGIATLKKNMSNKATNELVKEIKQYYK